MKIETKYDINQEVWAVFEDKVQKGNILRIKIHVSDTKTVVHYEVKFLQSSWTYYDNQIFATKEELIDNL